MDNDIQQDNFRPVSSKTANPPGNRQAAKRFLKILLLLLILVLVGDGVYWWQHSKVNSLSSSKATLSSEVKADNQKITSLNSKIVSSLNSKTTSSAACDNSQIKLSDTSSPGAAGNEGAALVFTNDSTSSCTLFGYPLIQYEDKNGDMVSNVVEELTGGMIFLATNPVSITLAPNQQASAGLNWTEGGANPSSAATTEVYLPGSSSPLNIKSALGPSTANTGDPFYIDVTAFQSGSSPKVN